MLENMSTPTADSNRLDQFLNFYISDKLRVRATSLKASMIRFQIVTLTFIAFQDIVKLTNVVRNWQDEIIPIGVLQLILKRPATGN